MIATNFLPIVISQVDTGGFVLQAFRDSGIMGKSIVLFLIFYSIICWAIMGLKLFTYFKMKRKNIDFLDYYNNAGLDLTRINDAAANMDNCPLARLFIVGFRELKSVSKIDKARLTFTRDGINIVGKALANALSNQASKMERHLIVLATAANVCPLIGLFGTVWGVLAAFRGMGMAGNASLATVGSGMSEALITTVAGLAVAIPSVMGYNYFQSKIADFTNQMEEFISTFLVLLEKILIKGKLESS